ncbi:Protein of unknown function DUF1802 [Gloeothece citriformis PCC 7424]|uniref:DUF1802 family protein n=1 Tax=Gloeothece citriformis (strain PCC 7424) TaxID=65393 RepID=B7KGV6_GLOC7|nr:DUF1802 family protein [Gloeothece citriformis]ACK73443.1 Protein of unknown function DUF1802 [Gloeothece citriformis PCC 7424]
MSISTLQTNHALKEWEVAINALEVGKTILLLRKGGIEEVSAQFEVKYRQVLLYPTYEHQNPNLLKPDYSIQVTPVTSGWHPDSIRIGSWAEITDIFAVSDAIKLKQLFPYHIWNQEFITDKLKWKPRQPLYLLLLRVYLLPHPVMIPYTSDYGGCKSWIDLQESIDLERTQPIFNDTDYQQQVSAIATIVKG